MKGERMKNNTLQLLALLLALTMTVVLMAGCVGTTTEELGTESLTDTESVAETEAETEPEPRDPATIYQHVVIVGVDGAGAFFDDADMPNLDALLENAAVTYQMRTTEPSISAQAWGTLLHGVLPAEHGLNNSIVIEQPYDVNSPYPSIFRLVRENCPDAVLGSFVNWNAINSGIIEDEIGVEKGHNANDRNLADDVVKYIKNNQPTLLFIQYDEVDEVGHGSGWGSDEYLKQLLKTDIQITRIYGACRDAGILDDTLFIVTADHGGVNNDHGGLTDDEMYVMLAVLGKTVEAGTITDDVNIQDIPVIVLYALGLEDQIPESWTGRVPDGLFRNETAE